MSQVLSSAVLVGFVAAWLTALVACFASVVYGIKAIRRARPGVKLWGHDTLWNPANVLLSSNLLTADGLRYRRKCFMSVGIFVACVGGTLLVAAITGQLK
jgi:hypothetical protein